MFAHCVGPNGWGPLHRRFGFQGPGRLSDAGWNRASEDLAHPISGGASHIGLSAGWCFGQIGAIHRAGYGRGRTEQLGERANREKAGKSWRGRRAGSLCWQHWLFGGRGTATIWIRSAPHLATLLPHITHSPGAQRHESRGGRNLGGAGGEISAPRLPGGQPAGADVVALAPLLVFGRSLSLPLAANC